MLINSTNLRSYLKLVEFFMYFNQKLSKNSKFLRILIKNYYADGITNIQPE